MEEEESKPKEDRPVVDTGGRIGLDTEEKWLAWRAAWLEGLDSSTCRAVVKDIGLRGLAPETKSEI